VLSRDPREELTALRVRKSGAALVIEVIDEPIRAELSRRNPDAFTVEGDEIVEVNGVRGNAQHLYEELRKRSSLKMRWRRRVEAERAERVLSMFEDFFKRELADVQSVRVSSVQPVLSLLAAPVLWMCEEVAQLLLPLHGVTTTWEPLVGAFELGSLGVPIAAPGSDGEPEERWQFQFAIVPLGSGVPLSAAHQVTCRASVPCGAGTASAIAQRRRPAGWDRLLINGSELAHWVVDTLPEASAARRSLAEAQAPFLLLTLLRPLLEALGEAGTAPEHPVTLALPEHLKERRATLSGAAAGAVVAPDVGAEDQGEDDLSSWEGEEDDDDV